MTVHVRLRPGVGDELPFLLDGGLAAQRFGVSVAHMRELTRRRMVQGRVEKGEGENAGRWRLTVRLGNRVWRGIFTADGELCDETIGLAGGRKIRHD
jgi:hypothetical protein